jgi:hypothetical protein
MPFFFIAIFPSRINILVDTLEGFLSKLFKLITMTKEYKNYVDIALRAQMINIDTNTVNQIIETVELIQKKGGKATIKDTCKLSSKHE